MSPDANQINVWTVTQVRMPIQLMCGQSSTSLDANLNNLSTVIQVWMPIQLMHGLSTNYFNWHPDLCTSPDANPINVWTVIHISRCHPKNLCTIIQVLAPIRIFSGQSSASLDVIQIICGQSSRFLDANPHMF
jgi:hypothetical protein